MSDTFNFEKLIKQLQEHESEDQLIIGLDFGTTFSGIAYAFTDPKKSDIVTIVDWPGSERTKHPKTPTVISYDPTDNSSFAWGNQEHKHRKLEGIKLLLDPDQETPLYVPATDTKAELRKLGKPPVEVAADYIGAIYKHAMERIESKVLLEYLQMCQKKFVLSVPAVWSDKAKDTTMRAAKQAGLHPVTLIKEPEAAALYTLYAMQEKSLAVGDALVICDAGGGTVDLISYEITSLSPKLELKELVGSKGGMAGSLQLNKRFEEAVKNLVGEDQYYHLRKTPGYAQAVEFFDQTVKIAFRGKKDVNWYVNFPMAELEDDKASNLIRNSWEMKSEVVAGIFKPLISNIVQLVDEQVNLVQNKRLIENHPKAKEIKAIFLVGGFGSSEYLKQCIAEAHPDIQIVQPHDAWAAIVKGAVLSQLPREAAVTVSVAPRHYGVSAMALFDSDRDEGQDRIMDESTGKWRVKKMTWYVHKNEDLRRDSKLKFPFFRSLSEGYDDYQLVFEDELLADDSVRASVHPKDGVTKVNCVLSADLTKVDRSLFKKRVGVDGRSYVDVHYDLIVTIKSAMMKFSLEINGQEMGSIDASYT